MEDTYNLLKRINSFIIEANKTNKTNDKKNVLKKYPDLKKILVYINNSMITFGITSKAYKKYLKSKKKIESEKYTNIYKLLDDLANRKLTGYIAAASLEKFISQYKEFEDIILRIIDKNLKTKTNTKLINKVYPGLVPLFEVALAEKFKEKKLKGKYYISRKLDGVRCICYYKNYGNDIKFYSRTGKRFVDKDDNCTLTKLYKPLREVFKGVKEFVLDGEICVIDEEGKEDFQKVVSQIRKNVDNPRYYMFDILSISDFEKGVSRHRFGDRYKTLLKYKDKSDNLKVLEQIEMTEDSFKILKEQSVNDGWEGLILRKNTEYKNGRSYDLMKYKLFEDDEFLVKEIITGPFRMVSKKTGLETTIETMTAVIIDFYDTKVGSGFTIGERERFYKNPEKIVGKKITVQYFEKSKNKDNDNLSLRFPTYKGIRNYE